jgi:hypothetical protein
MAVRLQMKLGVVAEQDRVADSPDTIVVVEPSVGSVARSKGNLYLLVTSRLPTQRAHEATRLTAETIRAEYYYDESAGIRVCLEKAIAAANKRLAHQRERLGLGHATDATGPIGIGLAVVRGHELYVATVGPAEAYLIRQARLSTLPDPHRDRGLPARSLEPDVWRGEIAVGDSLVLISPNVMARLGPEELKDALVTLHPQSAVEHLHHRFIASDGSGSDGAIAFEATEVAATHRQRSLVPVRPSEPLAGAPDRSPIPLADPVAGGVAAVQAGANQARAAAATAFERAVGWVQDLLPRRRPPYRRVTPVTARRETQRRAAVALLSFIVVAAGLGMGIFFLGGQQPAKEAISSITAGERALQAIRTNLSQVSGSGVDLVRDDPPKAMRLLTEAYAQLTVAREANVSAATLDPLRNRIVAGLDRLYGVVPVGKTPLFTFLPPPPGEEEEPEDPEATPAVPTEPAADLVALVEGPDGAPYVLDRGTKTVWRIDLVNDVATPVIVEGMSAAGATAAAPRLIARGGPDLLILDELNTLWRWRPADATGKGTLARIKVNGAASWGDDILAMGTYVRNADAGLYNLYIIDPSEQQILAYSPAADGAGFPARPTGRLSTARAVDKMTSLYIDGDIFVVEAGGIARFVAGKSDGWSASAPADTLLRPAPVYRTIASGSQRRGGRLYGWDPANRRIIAIDKADGRYREQYRLVNDDDAWRDIRGMFVRPGIDTAPALLYWISGDTLYESVLEAVTSSGATPRPAISPSPAETPDGEGSPAPAP